MTTGDGDGAAGIASKSRPADRGAPSVAQNAADARHGARMPSGAVRVPDGGAA